VSFLFVLISCSEFSVPSFYSESYINRHPNYQTAFELENIATQKTKTLEAREAVKIYTRIISWFTNYNHLYRVYAGRAIAYHQLLNFDMALKDYEKSVELYPHYLNAWVGLALLYKHRGEISKAEETFLKCIEIMPDKRHEFELQIYRLKGFSKAVLAGNKITFFYEFGEIKFKINANPVYKINSTNNPYQPYEISLEGVDPGNAMIFVFIMDFEEHSIYRLMSFKQRVQRWANFEQQFFGVVLNEEIPLKKVVEMNIGNKNCAFIDIEHTDKKIRLLFTFKKRFGIMAALKANTSFFNAQIGNLEKFLSNIEFEE